MKNQAVTRIENSTGGADVSAVKRLRELELENARLKRILAERDLEIDIVKEILGKK